MEQAATLTQMALSEPSDTTCSDSGTRQHLPSQHAVSLELSSFFSVEDCCSVHHSQNPVPQLSDETKNTLEYALRAKNIRNRPEVNQKVSSATHMANLSTENKRLKMELAASREKDGVFMPLAMCASPLSSWLCCAHSLQ